MFKNKKGVTLLAVGAAMFGLVGMLTPTVALAGNSQYCSGTYVCVYKNSGFNIGLGLRTAGFGLQNISYANDDEVSSWENRTGTNARWYAGSYGSGVCNNMARYSELSWMVWGQNDAMSSWAGNGSC